MLLGIGLLLLGFIYGYTVDVVLSARARKCSLSRSLGRMPCCGGGRVVQWPILSAFLLRLKCPGCGSYWPARSSVLQWISGFLFFECYFIYGEHMRMLASLLLCALLVAAAAFDVTERIVPNPLTLAGVAAGLCMNALMQALCPFIDALLGLLAGAGPLLILAGVGYLATKKATVGGGDIKLMGMVGAFLGWRLALLSLMLGAVAGGIILAVLLASGRIKKGTAVPFAPMLAVGSAAAALFGNNMISWYVGILG